MFINYKFEKLKKLHIIKMGVFLFESLIVGSFVHYSITAWTSDFVVH